MLGGIATLVPNDELAALRANSAWLGRLKRMVSSGRIYRIQQTAPGLVWITEQLLTEEEGEGRGWHGSTLYAAIDEIEEFDDA